MVTIEAKVVEFTNNYAILKIFDMQSDLCELEMSNFKQLKM